MVTPNIAIVPPASQQLSSPIVDVAVAPSTVDVHTKTIQKPVSKPVQPRKQPPTCAHKKKCGMGFGAARNKYGAVGKPRPAPATAALLAQPLMLTAGPQPVALLPAVCTVSVAKPAIDTSALVKAAEKKKEADMVVNIPASMDCKNNSKTQLAWVRDQDAYDKVMAAYNRRCAAKGTPDEADAQREWNRISAAAVLKVH